MKTKNGSKKKSAPVIGEGKISSSKNPPPSSPGGGIEGQVFYRRSEDGERIEVALLPVAPILRRQDPPIELKDKAYRNRVNLYKKGFESLENETLKKMESRAPLVKENGNGHGSRAVSNPQYYTMKTDDSFATSLLKKVTDMLEPGKTTSLLSGRNSDISESAFHDFAQYVYLDDPYLPYVGNIHSRFIDQLCAALRAQIANQITQTTCEQLAQRLSSPTPFDAGTAADRIMEMITNPFLIHVVYPIIEYLDDDIPHATTQVFIDLLSDKSARIVLSELNPVSRANLAKIVSATFWTTKMPDAEIRTIWNYVFERSGQNTKPSIRTKSPYPFEPFPEGKVNFGLRLVYRQEWRSIGTQPGEIVKTIPLGPKQSEKVNYKIVRTSKFATTSESSTQTETNTETSNTIKDSSDVVSEASEKLGLKADMSASANWGWGSANVSAGVNSETAQSSKESKSQLNESMEKTASKMRTENKVVVTTEVTSNEEYSTASEISNPNDEIAVTYIYSKLQKQYEIYTGLAEVNSVVFVPERVPTPNEITVFWIKKHQKAIAQNLLDADLMDALAATVSQTKEEVRVIDKDSPLLKSANAASENFAGFKAFKGTMPDIFRGAQDAYEKGLERNRAIEHKNAILDQNIERIRSHIIENLLFYLKCIWRAEDPDQRMQRYARWWVQAGWEFNPAINVNPNTVPTSAVQGVFRRRNDPTSVVRLSDIINPTGPIAFVGNYAVYPLKLSARLSKLNEAMTVLRSQYVKFTTSVTDPTNPSDPDWICDAYAVEPLYQRATYQVEFLSSGDIQISYFGRTLSATEIQRTVNGSDCWISFHGIRMRFGHPNKPVFSLGPKGVYTVTIEMTGFVEDPELRAVKASMFLPSAAGEKDFFDVATLDRLTAFVPELSLIPRLDDQQKARTWTDLIESERRLIRKHYFDYLLIVEHTRRFLLDTNNLYLDLQIGDTPALEEFKRYHRAIDVLKEFEEMQKRSLENERRNSRIEGLDYTDPDIENVTVVATTAEAKSLIGSINLNSGQGSQPAQPQPANPTGPTP